MPIFNKRKYSKSELLLKIIDPNTRKKTLDMIDSNKFCRLPSSFLAEFRQSNNCKKVKEKIRKNTVFTTFKQLKPIFNKNRLVRYLKNGSVTLELNENELESRVVQYSSELVQNYSLKKEVDFLYFLYENYKAKGFIDALKYCLVKISKESLDAFMKNFIWDFASIKDFLISIAHKMSPTAIQIWFENDYPLVDQIFSKFNIFEIDENTKFNGYVFEYFLQFDRFKKSIFNCKMNDDFIIGIKDYISRADYDYFYSCYGIEKSRNIHVLFNGKNYDKFSFFTEIKNENYLFSNLLKIANYQSSIGHNSLLNIFLYNNIDILIKNFDDFPIIKSILEETIRYNSAIEEKLHAEGKLCEDLSNLNLGNEKLKKVDSNAISMAFLDILYKKLQNLESFFVTVVKYFKFPKDDFIKNLCLKNYTFSLQKAIDFINYGFENELLAYFASIPIDQYIERIDDWTSSFFMKLFLSIELNEGNLVQITKFLLKFGKGKNFTASIEIFDKILNSASDEVYEIIPEQLRVIYVLRNKQFSDRFCDHILNNNKSSEKAEKMDISNFSFDALLKSQSESQTMTSLKQASLLYEVCYSHKLENYFTNSIVSTTMSPLLSIATSPALCFNSKEIINSLFFNNFILKPSSNCLIVQYFDQFLDEVLNKLTKEDIVSLSADVDHLENRDFKKYLYFGESGIERIKSTFVDDVNFDLINRISFVMKYNFSNKYTLFLLFEKIIQILTEGSSLQKIFVLSFLDPTILSKSHILRFIDCVIPLLNSPNKVVCVLSKQKFNMIKVENKEIQHILPEIAKTFENKNYFLTFYNVFTNILFNNYLCFNSLNIIVQVFFKYLEIHTKECLYVLGKIINIIKGKDIKFISGLVFSNISKFVVNNNFYTPEALEVATQFCLYTKFSDFETLLKNVNTLRICNYLVGILKVKGDTDLNNQIIQDVISSAKETEKDSSDSYAIEPAFIATACELPEFSKYISQFIPMIFLLFRSDKVESRQIACKAITSIYNLNIIDYNNLITEYLIECCINMDHAVKLSALDVLKYTPLIFILRNDQHTLVRKKATEIWKSRISNTNKELKTIFKDVLNLIKYKDISNFSSSLKASITEMAQKYCAYLEMYIDIPECSTENKEFILVEAVKANKPQDRAIDFCKTNSCPSLFKVLFKSASLREELINGADPSVLYEISAEDSEVALYLFNRLNDPIYIEFLTSSQKIDLIRSHYQDCKSVNAEDENVVFLLQSIESSADIESLLVKIHPSYSYFYISVQRVNHGFLPRIFERVFDFCNNLDELINERDIHFLKFCSISRIEDKISFLKMLIKYDDKKCFEKAVEILLADDLDSLKDQELLFTIVGYLLRNYLSKSRRGRVLEAITRVYAQFNSNLGYFDIILKNLKINL